jgi:hypothetical protein
VKTLFLNDGSISITFGPYSLFIVTKGDNVTLGPDRGASNSLHLMVWTHIEGMVHGKHGIIRRGEIEWRDIDGICCTRMGPGWNVNDFAFIDVSVN